MYRILNILFIFCPEILGNQYIRTDRKSDKYIRKQVNQCTCRSHSSQCMTSCELSNNHDICGIKQQLQHTGQYQRNCKDQQFL